MKLNHYTRTIKTTSSAEHVFWALTEGMHKWWTTPDNPMIKRGDRSKFSFPPGQSYWTFEATVLEPASTVEMLCVDAYHIHEGQPHEIQKEWLGTRVRWDIRQRDKGTKVTIEHHGLIPELLCYDICELGWDIFFVGSLQSYLNEGVGKPHES